MTHSPRQRKMIFLLAYFIIFCGADFCPEYCLWQEKPCLVWIFGSIFVYKISFSLIKTAFAAYDNNERNVKNRIWESPVRTSKMLKFTKKP